MIDWVLREPPLAPEGAFAAGEASMRLARRLLELDDAALARFRGVAAKELIIILGDELPWVDGIVYLGRDPDTPQLYLPTTRTPSLPLPLVARAVARRDRDLAPPFALLDAPAAIVSLAGAGAIDRKKLSQWLA